MMFQNKTSCAIFLSRFEKNVDKMTDLMLLFRYKLIDSTKMICDESIEKWRNDSL